MGVRFFDGVGDEQSRVVLAACRPRRFAARQVIFHEGDPADSMHFITTGLVSVRITTAEGSAATLDILGAGDPLGELALLTPGARRSATASALVETETMALPRSAFDELRGTSSAMADVLLTVLAERHRTMIARLLEALFVPVDTRVVRRLLDLARHYPAVDPAPVVIALSQEDLADLAGTTRETVNRVLRGLARQGTVTLARGRIALVDPAALARRDEDERSRGG